MPKQPPNDKASAKSEYTPSSLDTGTESGSTRYRGASGGSVVQAGAVGFSSNLLEWLPVALTLTRLSDGRIVEANPAFAALFELEPREVVGRRMAELRADGPGAPCTMLEKLGAAGEIHDFELEVCAKTGVTRWMVINAKLLNLPEGQFACCSWTEITNRKRAEETLTRSEAKFRALHESLRDAYAMTDLEGRILDFNPAFQDLVGYSAPEIGNLTYRDLTPAKWHAMEAEIVTERILAMGASGFYEKEYIRKDGCIVPVEMSVYRLEENGQPSGMWAIIRDISERKAADQAIRASEQRYRAVFDGMREGFAYCRMLYDAEGRPDDWVYLDVNQAFLETTGFRDIIGKRATELNPAAKQMHGKLFEIYGRVAQSGEAEEFELNFRAQGTWLRIYATCPEKGYFAAVFEDISERKRVQEALRLTQTSVDLAADSVLWLRPDGSYSYANDAACRLLGYTREELFSMGAYDVAPAHPRELWEQRWKELEASKSLSMELDFRTKSGRLVPVEVSANYVEFEGQAYNCAFVRDISERRRAGEALRESEEKFRSIAEQISDVLFLTDTAGTISYVSPASAKVFGCAPETMRGGHFLRFLDESAVGTALQAFTEDIAGGKGSFNLNLLMKRADGGLFHGELDASVFYRDGAVAGTLGIIRDISERVERERALRNSEQLLLESQAVARTGSYVLTVADGRWTDSPELSRIFGIKADYDRSVEGWGSLMHPEDRDRLRRYLEEEVLAARRPFDMEYRIVRHNDGAVRWVHGLGHLDLDLEGRPVRMVGTIQDITDRKLTELDLADSRESYRDMVENLNDILYTIEADGRLTYVSPVVKSVLGYEPAELLGPMQGQIVHPDDFDRMRRDIRTVLMSGALSAEYRFLTKGGDVRWMSTSSRPVVIKGQAVGLRGVLTDITERKLAEDQARDAFSRLEATLRAIPDLMFETDVEGRIYDFHKPPSMSLYVPPEAFLGKTMSEVLPECASREIAQGLAECAEQGWHRGSTLGLEMPDGLHWYELSAARKLPAGGNEMRFILLVRDITGRIRADEDLRRLRKAVETSGEVIFMTDTRGVFTFVNPAFTRLYGFTPEEVVGVATPNVLKCGRTDVAVYRKLWETVLAKQIFRGELVNSGRDGNDVVVEVSVNPVVDESGEIEGFLAVQRDVSERIRAEQERLRLESHLRQAQKLETIGTLAGGIAHDFNNILVPIMVYSDLAVRSLDHDHPIREDLLEVIKGAGRAKELVKQILTFSRQGEQELHPIEPATIIKEALKLMRASIPTTIAIQQEIDSDCGAVLADPSQLHQVLMNLCTNAYHAMGANGGTLAVTLKPCTLGDDASRVHVDLRPGHYVRLAVSDTGQGMSAATQDRIFEPFFTTKQVGEGTGLGLSVVHGIVAKYGGAIVVQSEPGHGSRFDVYLPRAVAAVPARVNPEAPVAGGKECVLIVDDEPAVAETLRRVLRRYGYAVVVAPGGPEALELFRADPARFHLVLTDQTMPQLTGDALARELIAVRRDIPIIIMTGYSETIDEQRCRRMGIDRLMMKPILPSDLARAVREVLDGVSS